MTPTIRQTRLTWKTAKNDKLVRGGRKGVEHMFETSGNGNGKSLRVAAYLRVSTRDKGQDPENQLREIRAECQRIGHDISPNLEYVEHETATGKRRRPELERLLYDAEHRKFSILVIWSIDRLSREGTLKTLLLLDRLNRSGVKVRSLKEPWLDPTSPTYELLLPIFAWVARAEALRISDRVRAGLARARAEGRRLGRPTVGISRERVAEAFAVAHSIRATAKMLGVSASTVARLLKQGELNGFENAGVSKITDTESQAALG